MITVLWQNLSRLVSGTRQRHNGRYLSTTSSTRNFADEDLRMSQENTVRLVLVQIEGEKEISNAQIEWYGFDRDNANDFSMALTQAVTDLINDLRKNDSRNKG